MSSTKRFFEVVLIIFISFLTISLVFLGLNFGFKFVKTISANVISENIPSTNGILSWMIITVFATLALFYVVRFLVHKDLFEIRGSMSELEVDY